MAKVSRVPKTVAEAERAGFRMVGGTMASVVDKNPTGVAYMTGPKGSLSVPYTATFTFAEPVPTEKLLG